MKIDDIFNIDPTVTFADHSSKAYSKKQLDQNERMKDLLRQIAYPKTKGEIAMDSFDMQKLIQSNFSLEDLS